MADSWSAFYWGDYARKTSHLSLQEHGAYLLLMGHYYSTGQPLPTNVERLYAVCKAFVDTERAAVDYILGEFFVLDSEGEGCYRHSRIDEELAKSRRISGLRRMAVGSRADRKPTNVTTSVPTNVEQVYTQPQPQPQSPKEKTKAAVATLPAWLPLESWNAFVEMRKKQRSPFTEHAKELTFKQLDAMRKQGQDPAAVLDQSVMNGWKGVYDLKRDTERKTAVQREAEVGRPQPGPYVPKCVVCDTEYKPGQGAKTIDTGTGKPIEVFCSPECKAKDDERRAEIKKLMQSKGMK